MKILFEADRVKPAPSETLLSCLCAAAVAVTFIMLDFPPL